MSPSITDVTSVRVSSIASKQMMKVRRRHSAAVQFLKGLLALGLQCSLCLQAEARQLRQELEPGLSYLQMQKLPEDLPSFDIPEKAGTLILDLRGTSCEGSGLMLLGSWLKIRPGADQAVLLLYNAETEQNLSRLLDQGRWPATLTLSIDGVGNQPDISVLVKPETDRLARERLAKGEKAEILIASQVPKERWDEEMLSKEHKTSGRQSGKEIEKESGKKKTGDASEAKEQVADPVLARAVHVHRTLTALKGNTLRKP
jgi:hypothetical protein